MAFLSIQSNPFESFGKRWEGAGDRAAQAAERAAEAANEVLAETLNERSEGYEGFNADIIGDVTSMQDADGDWRLGLPADSPYGDAARQAEYGTEEEPPQALMRTSQRRAKADAEAVLDEVLQAELFGGG